MGRARVLFFPDSEYSGRDGTMKRSPVLLRLTLALALMLALALAPGRARAHAVGLSTGEYRAQGSSLVAKLAFARTEVAALLPGMDRNLDGHITAAELDASRGLVLEKLLRRIRVTTGDALCAPVVTDAGLTEQDGLLVGGRWDCPASDRPFDIDLLLLEDLARGHRHVARAITDAGPRDAVLSAAEHTVHVPAAPALVSGAARGSEQDDGGEANGRRSSPPDGSSRSFFLLGVEHILTGVDHLVFLFGLVLVRARLRSLLAVVTAFTIAHSITLAIAVLGIWTPSPRIVEPAIALSIAYVGLENLFVRSGDRRWRITFPFGLVHGFGFAAALRGIGLARSSIPAALATFNLGVESGQLAALALLLPAILHLRKKTAWFDPRGVRILSGVIALAGVVWFVVRVARP